MPDTLQNWIDTHIPDQRGRTALVTGANSGLGYHTCRALASRHARVIMACRDLAKGQVAAAEIRREFPSAVLSVQRLDLADLASVRACAAELLAASPRLDLLINNAGVMALPYRRTVDGFEMQFGVNHLGHFALTGLLLEALLPVAGSRIVTVSSMMHEFGQINFDDLNSEQKYGRNAAYSQSKLANLLFAYELQRRLAAAGCGALSLGAHPGYAATNLQTAGPEMENAVLRANLMKLMNRLFAQSAAMGALPAVYAATAPGLLGGEYIGPRSWNGARGYPAQSHSSAASYDRKLAARLWTVSQQLTGVSYAPLPG